MLRSDLQAMMRLRVNRPSEVSSEPISSASVVNLVVTARKYAQIYFLRGIHSCPPPQIFRGNAFHAWPPVSACMYRSSKAKMVCDQYIDQQMHLTKHNS